MPAPPQPGVDFYGRVPWEAFSSNADGTNDYLTITPSITNAKSFHYRCWIHPKGDGTERVLVANDNAANVGIRIILTTTNQLQVILRNTSGTTILDATSLSNGYIDAMGMGTIDINVDLNATTYQMLWNGFDDSPITPATAPVNDTIDFGGNWAFWADPDGSQPFNGDVSQVFAIFGQTYIDLDTDSNWAKFVEDAALRPANMGYDFSRPYSAAPEFFLPMDSDDPGQNWGSESDLTEVGAFTAGTVTPLNFVFRLPLTDFPNTGGEWLQGSDNPAADSKEVVLTFHLDHDTGNDWIGNYGAVKFSHDNSTSILDMFEHADFDVETSSTISGTTPHQIIIRANSANTDDVQVWVDGVEDTSLLFIAFVEDALFDLANAAVEYRFGNSFPSNDYYNGGMGGMGMRNVDQTMVIDNFWDSVNSVPTWPGRKGENWFNAQPDAWNLLPGSGFRRTRGATKSEDMTELGTGQPLAPRTSWFV